MLHRTPDVVPWDVGNVIPQGLPSKSHRESCAIVAEQRPNSLSLPIKTVTSASNRTRFVEEGVRFGKVNTSISTWSEAPTSAAKVDACSCACHVDKKSRSERIEWFH